MPFDQTRLIVDVVQEFFLIARCKLNGSPCHEIESCRIDGIDELCDFVFLILRPVDCLKIMTGAGVAKAAADEK